jgi:hypothetical protein
MFVCCVYSAMLLAAGSLALLQGARHTDFRHACIARLIAAAATYVQQKYALLAADDSEVAC